MHLRSALREGTEQLVPGGRDQQGLLDGEQPLPTGEGLQQDPQGEHFVPTLQFPRLTLPSGAQLLLRRRTSSQGTRASEGFPVGKSRGTREEVLTGGREEMGKKAGGERKSEKVGERKGREEGQERNVQGQKGERRKLWRERKGRE